MEIFTRALQRAGGGSIHARSSFNQAVDLKDVATSTGGETVPVLFASELVPLARVFQLSTLPLQIDSIQAARHLACLASNHYRAALAKRGFTLLMMVPWPPTGIWTRHALTSPSVLSTARVRTYDQTSRTVFSAVSREAVTLPIKETMQELDRGAIDAVLSSGDGEAGLTFARQLTDFTAIHYAYPLSFMVVRRSALSTLTPSTRQNVLSAAAETESQLWRDLPDRIQSNRAEMERIGVTTASAPPELLQALRGAEAREIQAWRGHASTEELDVLHQFETRVPTTGQNAELTC
ncbi:TRAP transporter substrate-binding protein DctP [Burkholderia territorii]|uniref:TRAP transporter substrate-binding protein DctP n=1 Tax=Burkholderia territorii TaxID=1503055 RepID=UPI0018C894DC|nr:TRAP transporter substrate-binding protein DctP [Burkholderia territorii]